MTTSMLLKTVMAKKLAPRKLITHELALGDVIKAYEVFGNAGNEKALKVLLKGG